MSRPNDDPTCVALPFVSRGDGDDGMDAGNGGGGDDGDGGVNAFAGPSRVVTPPFDQLARMDPPASQRLRKRLFRGEKKKKKRERKTAVWGRKGCVADERLSPFFAVGFLLLVLLVAGR